MNRMLKPGLRLGLVAACLVYVLWGVDFSALGLALKSFSPWALVAVALVMVADYVSMGLRLRFITGSKAGAAAHFNACILGLGLNNVLPAKAGELAKALYLRKKINISLGQSLDAVFWERFFDLNALLTLGFAAAVILDQKLVVIPLAGLVALIWAGLFVLRLWPNVSLLFIKLLYFKRLKLLATEVTAHLAEHLNFQFFLRLGIYTAVTWGLYGIQYFMFLTWGAELSLSPVQAVAIFLIGAAGMAVPSTPGAVGVYEAVMVAALGMYGVGKEQALAVGLVLHMLQYIPSTVYALTLLAKSGLSLRQIRESAQET
ncbi:MAG: lysylphosphatidylglycerol synthase transmembrane domain-containing protein [Thermodesulfobacteriota bacterium]|nr:lysylphosphatidylglycerol synthase transmembrane domain-containing protein [Thermodesulfobacteriota bacterium]